MRQRNEELKEKILNGETEESVAIGAGSYTKSEWSKFLKDFDDAQDMIKQQIREEITKRVEKQEKIEEIEDEKFEKDIDKDIQDKKELEKKGYNFKSSTDSEVAAVLIDKLYKEKKKPDSAE